jgi:hypothetical protein
MYAHANGLGQTFYDCKPAGTYDVDQASAAAAAWPVTAPTKIVNTCTVMGGTTSNVCEQTMSSCACWGYADTGSAKGTGHVHVNNTPTCICPSAADPSWN